MPVRPAAELQVVAPSRHVTHDITVALVEGPVSDEVGVGRIDHRIAARLDLGALQRRLHAL